MQLSHDHPPIQLKTMTCVGAGKGLVASCLVTSTEVDTHVVSHTSRWSTQIGESPTYFLYPIDPTSRSNQNSLPNIMYGLNLLEGWCEVYLKLSRASGSWRGIVFKEPHQEPIGKLEGRMFQGAWPRSSSEPKAVRDINQGVITRCKN